jgi:hypothetical protein
MSYRLSEARRLEHLPHTRRVLVRFPMHMVIALVEMSILLLPSSFMNFTSTKLLNELRAVPLIPVSTVLLLIASYLYMLFRYCCFITIILFRHLYYFVVELMR